MTLRYEQIENMYYDDILPLYNILVSRLDSVDATADDYDSCRHLTIINMLSRVTRIRAACRKRLDIDLIANHPLEEYIF